MARSGSKTWRKDYRWQGARRTFTMGAYPAVRLADARQQAESSRPFVQIAQAWFDHHSASWSPRYCRDMREKLDRFVIPALGQLDIEAITRSDIETQLLAPILARGARQRCQRTGPPLQRRRPPRDRACR